MQFEAFYLNDLEDEFEEVDSLFIEASTWFEVLQMAEARAIEKKKLLAQLVRLE